MISFKCPHCQKPLGINDEHAGKKASCPGCKNAIVVPSVGAAKAAAPAIAAKPAAAPPARPAAATAPPMKPAAAAAPPAKPAAAPAAKPGPAPPAPPRPAPGGVPGKPAAAKPETPAAPPKPAAPPRPAAATLKPNARPAASSTPTPPPAETEIEEAAAQALADKPTAAAAAMAKQTTEFQCPWCDEKVSVSINMAGKQTPCPACSRIVKVPSLVKDEPLDWRKEKKGPSLAKRNDEELEGAWTTAKTETVDRMTLEAAGAVIEKREPVTWGQRAWYVIYVALIVGVGFGGYRLWQGFSTHKEEVRLYEKVMAYFDPETKSIDIDAATASAVHRAAGVFCLRSDQPDNFTEAHKHFQMARSSVAASAAPEHDAALTELARTVAEAVPDPKYVERAVQKRDAQKVIDRAMKDLEQALTSIRSPTAQADAYRLATRTLIAKQRPTFARLLAGKVPPPGQAEILGVVGLELLRAGQAEEAAAAADQALLGIVPPEAAPADAAVAPGKDEKPALLTPSVIALCVLLNKPPAVMEKLKAQGEVSWRIGHAEALARTNDLAKARESRQGLAGLEQWRLLATVAAVGLEKEAPDISDAETVLKALEGNKGLKIPKDDVEISWVLVRLARLAALADKVELAQRFAALVPDVQLLGQAQFEILRVRLERTKGPADDKWLGEVGDATLAYGRARCLMARHNARYGSAGAVLKAVEGWDPESDRLLGYIGVALGLQDSEQRK